MTQVRLEPEIAEGLIKVARKDNRGIDRVINVALAKYLKGRKF